MTISDGRLILIREYQKPVNSGRGAARGRGIAGPFVVVLLLVATIGAVGTVGVLGGVSGDSGVGAATADPGTAPAPTLSVDVARNDSTLVYRATVNTSAGIDRLRLDGAFGIYAVTAHRGFVASDGGYLLAEGRESGTLTARIDLSEHRETALGAVGPDGSFQAGDDWAFAPSPRFHLRWVAGDGAVHHLRFDDAGVTVRAPTDVAVGQRFVLIGPHAVHTREVDGRQVRIVVPASAAFDVGAERAFDLFARVQRSVGSGADEPITAFVLPEAVRSGGAASGADVWVRADAGEVTVAHEFAHASLSLDTTERTRWLREAAAEYVAFRVAGPANLSFAERVRHPDVALTAPSTWPDEQVPYREGAAVLAALDEELRAASDGRASVATLLRALSASPDSITHGRLLAAVSDAAGDETATWFDRTVQPSSSVDASRPVASAALASPPSRAALVAVAGR